MHVFGFVGSGVSPGSGYGFEIYVVPVSVPGS